MNISKVLMLNQDIKRMFCWDEFELDTQVVQQMICKEDLQVHRPIKIELLSK